VDCLFVIKLVENAIASKNDEIEFGRLGDFKCHDVRLSNYYLGVSIKLRQLGLNVSESSAHRQSTWENSVGSINDLLLPLESWVWVRYHRGVLVDSPPIFHYALHLNLISGLVVIRESENLLAKVGRHHSSAVTNICHVADVIDNYYDDGAGSGTIDFPDINNLVFSEL